VFAGRVQRPRGAQQRRQRGALHNDGDLMTTLDVLAKKVGILGIFSDWSGTVSYYASCMGLK
jgi:glycerophosphoryl diester phosphodiesterase